MHQTLFEILSQNDRAGVLVVRRGLLFPQQRRRTVCIFSRGKVEQSILFCGQHEHYTSLYNVRINVIRGGYKKRPDAFNSLFHLKDFR